MSEIALKFRERFRLAYQHSTAETYNELSRRAGQALPVTSKILSGHFDNSSVGPGIFTVKRLADAAGVSVGFLVGEDLSESIDVQSFLNGTARNKGLMERFMETHWRGSGRLEAFDALIEDCDVYYVPDREATTPQIKRIGKRTLFAQRLGGPFVKDAQRELNNATASICADAIAFHRRVVELGTAIENTFVDHDMESRPVKVKASNTRLGLLVRDAQGSELILLLAIPVPV